MDARVVDVVLDTDALLRAGGPGVVKMSEGMVPAVVCIGDVVVGMAWLEVRGR